MIRKIVKNLLLILLSLTLFVSCDWFNKPQEDNKVLLNVTIDSSQMLRSAQPVFPSLDEVTFTVTATKDGKSVSKDKTYVDGDKVTNIYQLEITTGDWAVSVSGTRNSDNKEILFGTGSVNVKDTGDYHVVVPVYFIREEEGSVNLQIAVNDTGIKCLRIISDAEGLKGDYKADANGIISISADSVAAGTYPCTLLFYTTETVAADSAPVIALRETFEIRKNMKTDTWIKSGETMYLSVENNKTTFRLTKEIITEIASRTVYVKGEGGLLEAAPDVNSTGTWASPFDSLQKAFNRVVSLNSNNASDSHDYTIFVDGNLTGNAVAVNAAADVSIKLVPYGTKSTIKADDKNFTAGGKITLDVQDITFNYSTFTVSNNAKLSMKKCTAGKLSVQSSSAELSEVKLSSAEFISSESKLDDVNISGDAVFESAGYELSDVEIGGIAKFTSADSKLKKVNVTGDAEFGSSKYELTEVEIGGKATFTEAESTLTNVKLKKDAAFDSSKYELKEVEIGGKAVFTATASTLANVKVTGDAAFDSSKYELTDVEIGGIAKFTSADSKLKKVNVTGDAEFGSSKYELTEVEIGGKATFTEAESTLTNVKLKKDAAFGSSKYGLTDVEIGGNAKFTSAESTLKKVNITGNSEFDKTKYETDDVKIGGNARFTSAESKLNKLNVTGNAEFNSSKYELTEVEIGGKAVFTSTESTLANVKVTGATTFDASTAKLDTVTLKSAVIAKDSAVEMTGCTVNGSYKAVESENILKNITITDAVEFTDSTAIKLSGKNSFAKKIKLTGSGLFTLKDYSSENKLVQVVLDSDSIVNSRIILEPESGKLTEAEVKLFEINNKGWYLAYDEASGKGIVLPSKVTVVPYDTMGFELSLSNADYISEEYVIKAGTYENDSDVPDNEKVKINFKYKGQEILVENISYTVRYQGDVVTTASGNVIIPNLKNLKEGRYILEVSYTYGKVEYKSALSVKIEMK